VRKVVVYELVSLDGVAEDPDQFIDAWDEVMGANLAAVIAKQDAVILGHKSFLEWSAFWPTSEIEPFATFINAVPKYVATSTPLEHEWHGASAIDGDVVAFVRDLKSQSGGDIGVHASIAVAQALLASDVVDELSLVIAPRILGHGRPLYDHVAARKLESLRVRLTPTGHLLATFRVLP
jgi:dihydrofolate reductase